MWFAFIGQDHCNEMMLHLFQQELISEKITCVFLLQKRLLHYFFSALVFYHFIFSKLETAQLIFNILSFQIKVKASFDEEQLLHNVSFLTIDSSFEYPQAFYVLKTSLKKSRCVFLLFKLST